MSATKIFQEGSFTATGAHLFQPEVTTVIVENDAYITQSANTWGMLLEPPGAWTVTVNGALTAPQDALLLLTGDSIKNSKVSVGVEGYVWSATPFYDAIHAFQALDVSNAGTVNGAGAGIHIGNAQAAGKGSTITNAATGAIIGQAGSGIDSDNPDLTLTVKNAGTIAGSSYGISWMHGATITNTGTITGNLLATDSGDTMANSITNSGSVGGIQLSSGNDMVKNTGHIDGAVFLYAGNNTLINGGVIERSIYGGIDIDTQVHG